MITIEEPVAERHDRWHHHDGRHHARGAHRTARRSRTRTERAVHSLVHIIWSVALLATSLGVAAWAVGFALDQF